jgi:hypothetical protein
MIVTAILILTKGDNAILLSIFTKNKILYT